MAKIRQRVAAFLVSSGSVSCKDRENNLLEWSTPGGIRQEAIPLPLGYVFGSQELGERLRERAVKAR